MKKISKTFKDFGISKWYGVSICLYNDTLFGLVAPITAYKINVQVNWSSRLFSQNFNVWSKHAFPCINVRQVPRDMFKT